MTRAQSRRLPVIIAGGGFSGTLLAINLLRQNTPVVLVERNDRQLARGLAFGTRQPDHLLNVRASNMSAFPDDPGHFLRWMGFSDKEQANRFVPRLSYGLYLREILLGALADAGARATLISGEVTQVRPGGRSCMVELADGAVLLGAALVLALGNLPPNRIPAFHDLPESLLVENPWSDEAYAQAERLQHVLLLGTGLTAVDVVLSLQSAGFTGRITALSRRGLRPLDHAVTGPEVVRITIPQQRGARLIAQVRRRAAEVGWRAAVDELRPHTQDLWRRHSADEQRRLLRHARPYWDVHRHRLAPAVAARIDALTGAGRLAFHAGKVRSAAPTDGGVAVSWRPRNSAGVEQVVVDRIINCTGPDGDLARSSNALVKGLLESGLVRPDAHRLGLDVDRLGRVFDAGGRAQGQLYAVGPLTKGEAWEMVAVPDIRRQVWDLARHLSNSRWVGGEGL